MNPADTPLTNEPSQDYFPLRPIPATKPLSVIVPYYRNKTGLAITLTTLQAQLVPPQSIIVIDTSPNKSGLEIASRYATHEIPVIIEVATKAGIYEAWNKGLSLAGDQDVVIINDDLLLPINFIDILSYSRALVPALAYAPLTPPREHYRPDVDVEFSWWNEVPTKPEHFSLVRWLPGFCFMLTREAVKIVGEFDEGFKVWFGDDDYQKRLEKAAVRAGVPPIVRVNTLYAYHYGGQSYRYQSKAVKAQINKDRAYFNKKYGEKTDR